MSKTKTIQFDWQKIKRKVEDAFANLDGVNHHSAAEEKDILKTRAQALAASRVVGNATVESIEVLEFQLAQEDYAIETRYIREACPLDNLTRLPGTPDFVMGVVNLRGEILSVVDIKRFFGLPEKGITHLNKLIVLELGNMVFSILADSLVGVRQLPITQLQNAQKNSTGINGRYIQGITAAGLAVLDAGVLLTDEKIIVQ